MLPEVGGGVERGGGAVHGRAPLHSQGAQGRARQQGAQQALAHHGGGGRTELRLRRTLKHRASELCRAGSSLAGPISQDQSWNIKEPAPAPASLRAKELLELLDLEARRQRLLQLLRLLLVRDLQGVEEPRAAHLGIVIVHC